MPVTSVNCWRTYRFQPGKRDHPTPPRLRSGAIAPLPPNGDIPHPIRQTCHLSLLSPSAALNAGGYIDRLKQAHNKGLQGNAAILWARTWFYRHPSGTKGNAPRLGNTYQSIQADQKRRMEVIETAIAHFPAPPSPIIQPLPSVDVWSL